MSTLLKTLIAAPEPLAQSLHSVLLALGENPVYLSKDHAELADAELIFIFGDGDQYNLKLDQLPSKSTLVVKIIASRLTDGVLVKKQANTSAQPVLSLYEPFYYQEVLDVLYAARQRCQPSVAISDGPECEDLVGTSAAIATVRKLLRQVADKAVTVMVNGPSGSGKEVVARTLHRLSERSAGPFVPINCGAIPRELLESELFGHERGAFTGAISSRAGRFEMAEGGSLFLDEIGDMPLDMQVKILRVLQERCFERVGSNKTQIANVRIIAATHRNLEAMIAAGEFREDLYYRLNVFPIEVPSLAQRSEDIPHLIRVISAQLQAEGLGRLRLSGSAIASLQSHHWSGNIRELANLLERLAIMFPSSVVGNADLPPAYRYGDVDFSVLPALGQGSNDIPPSNDSLPAEGLDMKSALQDLERNWIAQALDVHQGVVSKAAQHLGLRRTTLIEKMRKLDIQA
ncbi:MAG: sigma-54 specific flagellar transcriptional regulator A [Zhongshania sp.]|jgi:sigma-54 specific flagellar transcriptional regulator A